MDALYILLGLALILIVLVDTFVSIILPRSVATGHRLTSIYYTVTWRLYGAVGRRKLNADGWLAAYGPLSVVGLFGLWAVVLILGFALMQYGLRTEFGTVISSFGDALYSSGVMFFTLGFGDIVAHGGVGRAVSVFEAGTGFAFLAVVISYLPVLYQCFSRRETMITMLDARAGSPPSGAELIRRYAKNRDIDGLTQWLTEWEKWSAELLESYLSYPLLAYYRSQHAGQSWLSSIVSILDACVLIEMSVMEDTPQNSRLKRQAQLTYAMSRHACVDLALIFDTKPMEPDPDRLPFETYLELCEFLGGIGVDPKPTESAVLRLKRRRDHYEPYMEALARRLLLELPPWIPEPDALDNWQTSAWETPGHF